MSGKSRPDDGLIGAIFIGALVGFGGGAILGKSILFGLFGAIVLLGAIYVIIVDGTDNNDSGGTGKPE